MEFCEKQYYEKKKKKKSINLANSTLLNGFFFLRQSRPKVIDICSSVARGVKAVSLYHQPGDQNAEQKSTSFLPHLSLYFAME